MSTQLIWPHIFAAGAATLAALVILYGLWQRSRWGRAIAQLRDVSQGLEATYGLRSHREIHHSFDDIVRALSELSKRRPAARWVLDELRPVVAQYHRRSVVGSAGAWDEIRSSFLERKRHPVRLTRAAAGWVVLLGLAGTVLGFMEALPALREVLASQADQVATASPPTVDAPQGATGNGVTEPERSDVAGQAALTGQKLNRVLDSLRGVFLATFWGVISAFFLSACNLLLLEPAFDRFADNVDVLGARWFEPLIHPPDTLIDDALRGELRSYFDEIGKRLETVLNPLISQLRLSLEQMSGLASDFSGNIRMGVDTIENFHRAVEKLGGSAQGAVDQLVQIVRTSGDFVKEVESLQQKGLDKLAGALAGPAQVLASSAGALSGQVSTLSDSSKAIAEALGAHSHGEAALREDIASNVEILRTQLKAISHLGASIDSTAESLRVELTPLFSKLSKDLIEAQTRSAHESRATAEKVAAGVDSIRGMLVSLQALASPERIREEKRAIEELRKAVENLSRQAGQQPTASRTKQAPQPPESEEIRRLKAEVRSMRRQERPVPKAPPASLPSQIQRAPQAMYSEGRLARLLRWLGFGRASNDHPPLLNETHDQQVPVSEEPRSEHVRQHPFPKAEPSVDFHPTQSRSSAVDLRTLIRVVSPLLEEEPGNWDIERLLESLRRTMDGNDSVEVQHLVPANDGKGRLVALWPQGSQEGLALVTSGELADDTIIRYFDVSFGRRIIACRQPARVSRSGDEVTVLNKGKVESS
jgi:hypothetical protein